MLTIKHQIQCRIESTAVYSSAVSTHKSMFLSIPGVTHQITFKGERYPENSLNTVSERSYQVRLIYIDIWPMHKPPGPYSKLLSQEKNLQPQVGLCLTVLITLFD
ncbi:hypothetical protein FGO68_gene3423 [Halteria grandinella]|uniref:Uncharacterized protein n=1 Tax=Halteria grandinella TaxID=5974 RepID=A0A8J8T4J1_HALGN|nr:hypothetical protein FGO68_gene3423 [Halteria grandinella]